MLTMFCSRFASVAYFWGGVQGEAGAQKTNSSW